jgi:7-cyano-7-deazaguanine synthase
VCSIFGALGTEQTIDVERLTRLRQNAGDRGRDGGRMERYVLHDGRVAYLGNWRATPTPELEHAPLQPYDCLVHNGTVANDVELGALAGEVDSMVLARMLDRSSLPAFSASLQRVVGSYAVACATPDSVFVGVNYKPLYYAVVGGAVYFSSMARHFRGLLPMGHAPVAIPPYSVVDLSTFVMMRLPRRSGLRALVIASAGLDSTTVASMLVAGGWAVTLLHFRYGCRAQGAEERAVRAIAARMELEVAFVDLPRVAFEGSTLTTERDYALAGGVSGAEYAHEWVPARNTAMLGLAAAYAEAHDQHLIALGNNLEEAGAYPDNEEEFTARFNDLLPWVTQNGYALSLDAPVGHLMKHEIVARGLELKTPYDLTWSCYRDGVRHCGRCGPCFMRRTAFARNGVTDPVAYEE